MTIPVSGERAELLRLAAARATLAPSVHNSQPWRFRLGPDTLDLVADPERRLRVLDPTFRQLIISCGCALFNARVALAASRREIVVDRLPDPAQPDVLARVTITDRPAPWTPLVRLEPAIDRRHSNRREFFERVVPEEIQWELVTAAAAEDSQLVAIETDQARSALVRLTQEAHEVQTADPAYVAELREWTTDIPGRKDGITSRSFPMSSGTPAEIPLRDFGVKVTGLMAPVAGSDRNQCLMVLATAEDTPAAWLRAGEALERLWLEATRLDYVASLFTQVIEVKRTRAALRRELGLDGWPHILLRIGQAAPNVATNRRPLSELITELDG